MRAAGTTGPDSGTNEPHKTWATAPTNPRSRPTNASVICVDRHRGSSGQRRLDLPALECFGAIGKDEIPTM